jgi:LPS sulfotransferase NodH
MLTIILSKQRSGSTLLIDFLGVKECSLTTKLVKQNPKDPKDSVLNYEELL